MFQLVGVTKLSCYQLGCLTQLVSVRRQSWAQLLCPGWAACSAPPRPCSSRTAAAAPPDSPWSDSASAAPRPARTAPSGTCSENIFIECLKNIFIEYQYPHSGNIWNECYNFPQAISNNLQIKRIRDLHHLWRKWIGKIIEISIKISLPSQLALLKFYIKM